LLLHVLLAGLVAGTACGERCRAAAERLLGALVYAVVVAVGVAAGGALSSEPLLAGRVVAASLLLAVGGYLGSIAAAAAVAPRLTSVGRAGARGPGPGDGGLGLGEASAAVLLAASLAVGGACPGASSAAGLVLEPLVLLVVAAAGLLAGSMLRLRGIGGRVAGVGAVYAVLTLFVGAVLGALTAPLLGVPVSVGAVVGAASGWYSLAGPVAAAAAGPLAGVYGFLSNMAREAIHIALYPLLARRGFALEAVAGGGATAMDTGLPVIVAYGGAEASAAALTQGLLITIAAPLLAALLAGAPTG